jgi:uncharacterized protein (DUF1697 family)
MGKWIAFLRAINVGGHTVKMDRLRELFQSFGFSNVETFIASGNVIFETPDGDAARLEREIEHGLQAALGYEVATFVRSLPEIAAIANYRPFPPADLGANGSTLYIAFLQTPLEAALQPRILALRTPLDDFHINEGEIYWLRRRKMGESVFSGARLEKTIRRLATMRNFNTVERLAAKYV